MSYTRVNWKDYPTTTTPITAANLNVMDEGISDVDADLTTLGNVVDKDSIPSALGTTVGSAISSLNSSVSSLSANKANTSTVNSALALKADKSALGTQVTFTLSGTTLTITPK